MTDDPIRSSTSYYTARLAEAKRTLGMDPMATLDDVLKKINTGGTVEMTMEQWLAYGVKRFYKEEHA